MAFKGLVDKAVTYYTGLTSREQAILSIAGVLLALMGMYQIYVPIRDLFVDQSLELIEARGNVETISKELKYYYQLRSRRDEIENAYKQVEAKEGALSRLEKLVRERLGLAPGLFTITDRPAQPFGSNYEQTPVSIRFRTTSLQSLVEFLKEVSHGKDPHLITKLDVQKSFTNDRLDVDVELSSISKVNKNDRGEKPNSPSHTAS